MSAKEDFVLRALQQGANRAELCREFGISRKTGYKWIRRYQDEGLAGLSDVTRKPHHSPLEISGELVAEIVSVRQAHPRWGAKKIAACATSTLRKKPRVRALFIGFLCERVFCNRSANAGGVTPARLALVLE